MHWSSYWHIEVHGREEGCIAVLLDQIRVCKQAHDVADEDLGKWSMLLFKKNVERPFTIVIDAFLRRSSDGRPVVTFAVHIRPLFGGVQATL